MARASSQSVWVRARAKKREIGGWDCGHPGEYHVVVSGGSVTDVAASFLVKKLIDDIDLSSYNYLWYFYFADQIYMQLYRSIRSA